MAGLKRGRVLYASTGPNLSDSVRWARVLVGRRGFMSRRPVLVRYGDGRLLIGIDRFVPFRLTETGRLLPVVGGMDSRGDMGIVAAGAD